ncbi:hypothetical protein ACP275_02G134100 [Erythranthe tilingii]
MARSDEGLATVFTFQNRCSYIIWPATHSGVVIADGGFALQPRGTIQFYALPGCGEPPVTLAGFSLAAKDFYDVSLVDGYNVGVGLQPTGSSGDCRYAACAGDVIGSCPKSCSFTCVEFHTSEYCCNGDHSSLETWGPTAYSLLFKGLCLSAYNYEYDDRSSTFTCSGPDYSTTFCAN